MNNVTVESIELALVKREVKQDDDMKLFDKVTICASVTKNGLNLLTANEVREKHTDQRKELEVNTPHFLPAVEQSSTLEHLRLFICLIIRLISSVCLEPSWNALIPFVFLFTVSP